MVLKALYKHICFVTLSGCLEIKFTLFYLEDYR